MRYRVIANDKTSSGFAMFGAEGVAVSNAQQAKEALKAALCDEGLGAVVLSKEVGEYVADEVAAHAASCRLPQVLVLDI